MLWTKRLVTDRSWLAFDNRCKSCKVYFFGLKFCWKINSLAKVQPELACRGKVTERKLYSRTVIAEVLPSRSKQNENDFGTKFKCHISKEAFSFYWNAQREVNLAPHNPHNPHNSLESYFHARGRPRCYHRMSPVFRNQLIFTSRIHAHARTHARTSSLVPMGRLIIKR